MRNPFRQIEYLGQTLDPKKFPRHGTAELCLAGRSNVGKSSFLNRLAGRKSLARISSKPGKTQALTFYQVGMGYLLVDLPGYGFAHKSRAVRSQWKKSIETYLEKRKDRLLLLLVVDGRLPPQQNDILLLDFVHAQGIRSMVVATKMDKIPKGRHRQHLNRLQEGLQLPPEGIFLFSAKTGLGLPAILTAILTGLSGLSATSPEPPPAAGSLP